MGLSLILPIGPQNVFVLEQGLIGGLQYGLMAAVTAGLCDSVLILAGAGGVSGLLTGIAWLQKVLLLLGVVLLGYLGVRSLWAGGPSGAATPAEGRHTENDGPVTKGTPSPSRLILMGIAVSWGNPHAILDTVAILGSAIVAHEPTSQTAFATGAVMASWLFFLALALVGALFRRRLTSKSQVWLRRISGTIMLFFAIYLGRELVGF
ncbi:MAG: LysE family transporter [Firmicutes bacterium]|nr:LysE family transporter [Bacillota bacterium]